MTILTANTNFSKRQQRALITTRRVWLYYFGCVQSWFACSCELEFSYTVYTGSSATGWGLGR